MADLPHILYANNVETSRKNVIIFVPLDGYFRPHKADHAVPGANITSFIIISVTGVLKN